MFRARKEFGHIGIEVRASSDASQGEGSTGKSLDDAVVQIRGHASTLHGARLEGLSEYLFALALAALQPAG